MGGYSSFTGNNVTTEELKFVAEQGAVLNLDSVSALKRLAEVVDPEGFKISFRVNPMIGRTPRSLYYREGNAE